MSEGAAYAVVAEFGSPESLVEAASALREQGFTRMDACTPFPVHGIDRALGIRKSPLGWYVLIGGLTGAALALLMQWWTGAVDYPLVIGGKPLFAFEPSIPITFELAVLLAAFTAVVGMFALNGLPQLYHPLFEYEGFRGVTDDKFLLAVEAADPHFHIEDTPAALRHLGALTTGVVREDAE